MEQLCLRGLGQSKIYLVPYEPRMLSGFHNVGKGGSRLLAKSSGDKLAHMLELEALILSRRESQDEIRMSKRGYRGSKPGLVCVQHVMQLARRTKIYMSVPPLKYVVEWHLICRSLQRS